MRILFASSEVAPFSKTGGLADVAGALPARLRNSGHDVRTVTPLHRSIDRSGLDEEGPVRTTQVGDRRIEWSLRQHRPSDTFFVECDELFDRPGFYTHDDDEHIRWAAFSRIVVDLAAEGGADVVHCNDWQTGLVPLWAPEDLPTVLTIHNLGYQGWFAPEAATEIGLAPETPISLLATGIRQADLVTTVSPTYAREIQTPEGGAGLHSLLQTRSADLVGILNGIDVDEWNPRTDRRIARTYDERSLDRKEENTRALLRQVGLPEADGAPTVVMVSRLVEQKGLDIMEGPLSHFLSTWDLRVVVLGSGDAEYERMLSGLAAAHPKKMAFVSGYDEDLSHRMEAGGDIFLMPSLYEPCGLNQMYSLAYGTVPVVRKVGGLADTVRHVDPTSGEGTGFVFEHFTEDGLGWALGQALTLHIDRRSWRIVQRNGMAEDNSWERRAAEYEDVYRRLVEAQKT